MFMKMFSLLTIRFKMVAIVWSYRQGFYCERSLNGVIAWRRCSECLVFMLLYFKLNHIYICRWFDEVVVGVQVQGEGGPRRLKRTGLGGSPSLSIVNPLDVLRQRLLLEIARRRMRQSEEKIHSNREWLMSIGKRSVDNEHDKWASYSLSPCHPFS